MSHPPGCASYCKLSIAIIWKMTRERSSTRSSVWETMKPDTQRHWQTLLSSAQIYNTLPSNLGLFSSWHPKASVRCMPAELKCARRVHTAASLPAPVHSPCLPWHFLSLMEKMVHCKRQVKCQTAYLYILISNNEAQYLPTIWCQWLLCRVDWAVCLLFAFYLHENCTNKIGERPLCFY